MLRFYHRVRVLLATTIKLAPFSLLHSYYPCIAPSIQVEYRYLVTTYFTSMGALPKRKPSGFRKRRRRRKLQELFNKRIANVVDRLKRINKTK